MNRQTKLISGLIPLEIDSVSHSLACVHVKCNYEKCHK